MSCCLCLVLQLHAITLNRQQRSNADISNDISVALSNVGNFDIAAPMCRQLDIKHQQINILITFIGGG